MAKFAPCFSLFVLSILAAFPPQPQPQAQESDGKFPGFLKAKPLKMHADDDDLRKLLQARYNEALAEFQARYKQFAAGGGVRENPLDKLFEAEGR